MTKAPVRRRHTVLIWIALAVGLMAPVVIAAQSPLLAWREPIYIIAGFAGILGLVGLVLQPALAAGWLPGIGLPSSRKTHRVVGAFVFAAVVVHVVGLWITSPPDVIDVLLFRSPTPFSIWGAVAMWAVFATAIYAALRKPLRVPPRLWRRIHLGLAAIIVICTIVHAVQIDGTMGTLSKAVLCAFALAGLGKIIWDRARAKRP